MRGEYFNVFNHPNFGGPEGLWGADAGRYPGFGRVVAGTLKRALGSGGNQGGYAPGGPRSAQSTLRLSF